MKKFIVAVMSVVIIGITVFIVFMSTGGKSVISGFSLRCDNDTYMIIEESGSPIRYSFDKAVGANTKKLTDGDRILIISDLINESYPGSTRAYFILKTADGEIEDIPSETLISLSELGWYNIEE